MTNTTRIDSEQAVAVLGLPALARALADAGLRVVTGETFRAAAAATNAQLKVATVPLILADVAVAGTLPWMEKVLRTCPAVLVGVNLTEGQTRVAGNTADVPRIPAPTTIDTLLVAAGLAPLGDGAMLEADGSTTALAQVDAVDRWGDPGPVAPINAVDEVDSWGDPGQDVPADAPPARVYVAPVEPTPIAYAAPVEPVAPVAYQAPVVTQVEPTPAPVYVEPVAYQAPAVTPVEPTPAPVSVAPVAYPLPVAPPLPSTDFWGAATPPAPAVATPAPWEGYTVPPVAPLRPPVVVIAPVGVETTYSPTLGRNLAPVVFTAAGKGGVGKTSIALALAQRAAIVGGLKVVLIDANRGQGDLRIYLGLNKAGLPTVYDAVTTGDPAAAIVTPDRLNANRPAGAEQLGIALVQAPPYGLADPTTITAALYHDVITAARSRADLVVIDTQIVEGSERGMFDDLIIPMLASHAYALGIADLSKPGVDNLVTHLKEFIAQGVPTSRLMTMLNRVPETTEFDLQKTSDALSRYGQFLASIPADPDVHSAMAYGTSIQDNPVLSPLLDRVLMRVTGNPVFAEVTTAPVSAPKRRSFFRRGRG